MRTSTPESLLRPEDEFAGQRILVCGASGNLGTNLAVQLARPSVSLALWGRDTARLNAVAADCRRCGAEVTVRIADLSDPECALAALRQDDDGAPFDSAFFVSGAGDTREAGRIVESPEQLIRLGVLNFVAPMALSAELGERMGSRGHGRIALVGTAGAYHPLPSAAGYTSSKRGLVHFAEALRIALAPHGVSVTLVSPGFFSAPLGKSQNYRRPGEIPVGLVVERMIRSVARRDAELVTPWYFVALRAIGAILPRWVSDRLMLMLGPT